METKMLNETKKTVPGQTKETYSRSQYCDKRGTRGRRGGPYGPQQNGRCLGTTLATSVYKKGCEFGYSGQVAQGVSTEQKRSKRPE